LATLSPAETAWLTIWRRKHGLTSDEICRKLREKKGADIDPATLDEYLLGKGVRMHEDIEFALVLQLDSLGLRLFVDESGRSGQQYPAAEFGRIDLLTIDSNGDFVVIELKRDDAPRATIGQIAGYIAFVKRNLAKSRGHSVVGWILARPSAPSEDRVLEESADAVGILVKWYDVRLEFL
jgi:hypothetical protein